MTNPPEHHDGETLIEHFEKCVPGGREALAKARQEMEAQARSEGRWPWRRRKRRNELPSETP